MQQHKKYKFAHERRREKLTTNSYHLDERKIAALDVHKEGR